MSVEKAKNKLVVLAQEHGLDIKLKNGGQHIQVIGGNYLVNWYPYSKGCTAYVAGTVKGIQQATPERVIKMAIGKAKVAPKGPRDQYKSGRSRNRRKRLLSKNPRCHWCNALLDLDTSTLEHVVPLSQGGLDHSNNWALACDSCNRERGSKLDVETDVRS